MKNNTVVILGTSRPFGNTRKVLDELLLIKTDIDVIDLNDYNIGYFDYEFKNKDDDFFKLMDKVITYGTIIFASPVYWYTMSAQLKTFFDRMSDLLFEGRKELGRQLRGKSMAVISCGSDDAISDAFKLPFSESSNYLGMLYKGHVHTWVGQNSIISDEVKNSLKLFVEKI